MKRFYHDGRPQGISRDEQAIINEANMDELTKCVIEVAERARDELKMRCSIQKAVQDGEVAFVSEEMNILTFNESFTFAKYGDKKVSFRNGSIESEMLRLLTQASVRKCPVMNEAHLVASVGRAIGKEVDFKAVRNARSRINQKMLTGLRLANAVEIDKRGGYSLNRRYLRARKK